MKIFLVTDMHIGEDVAYPKDFYRPELGKRTSTFGSHFEKYKSQLIDKANSFDLAFNLGDLISDKDGTLDESQYADAINSLKTDILIKHVLGNHDTRNINKESIEKIIGSKTYYSFDHSGYHHIVLDGTPSWKQGPFYISEEQFMWLQNDLDATQLKTIVYCHFPLDKQSMESNPYFVDIPERSSIANKIFVRTLLQKSKKVIAAFSGHTHYYSKQIINGIPYFTVPSYLENNGEDAPSLKYAICTINDDSVELEIESLNHAI